MRHGYAQNISRPAEVERGGDIVWDMDKSSDYPFFSTVRRRCTARHSSIEPILVEEPFICTRRRRRVTLTATNAPFATPLKRRQGARMLSSNNLLKPQDGKPVTVPTQDGSRCYYDNERSTTSSVTALFQVEEAKWHTAKG